MMPENRKEKYKDLWLCNAEPNNYENKQKFYQNRRNLLKPRNKVFRK